MTPAERVGQLFMVAASSTAYDDGVAAQLTGRHVGSLILLGNSTLSVRDTEQLVDRYRVAAGEVEGIQLMVAVDQEGGLVQRLRGPGFDQIPSATVQGTWSAATLRSRAQGWGRELRTAGIDADLAPVADVVPADMSAVNEPIGVLRREYGATGAEVATHVTAVVDGMRAADIATSVKHFPGLGRVRGNTDTDASVVDTVTTRHDPDLAGFAAGADAGADMLMVSSATYRRIDPHRPATFSTAVISTMARGDLGFRGVIISDDLAGRALSGGSVGSRATRFFAAGGDLAIVGDPGLVDTMIRATLTKARTNRGFAAEVRQAAVHVLTMKSRRGVGDGCG